MLIPPGRARRWGAVGGILAGLGLAAILARVGDVPLGELGARIAVDGTPLDFLRITSAIHLIGAVLAIAAAIGGLRAAMNRGQAALAAVFTLAGAGQLLWGFRGVVGAAAGAGRVALLALGIGAGLALLVALGWLTRLGPAVRWLDGHWLAPRPPGPLLRFTDPADQALSFVLLVGIAGTVLAQPLAVMMLSALIAAVAGHALMRRAGEGTPLPVLPLFVLALIPVYRFMAAIVPPDGGLTFRALIDAPWSPAAENLLVPYIAVAAWGFLGFWPFHGLVPGRLLAPLGGVLLLRLAGPLPDGLLHWSPVIVPLAALAIWHAALAGPARAEAGLITLLSALAVLGITVDPVGTGAAAAWLLGLAGLRAAMRRALEYLPPLTLGLGRLAWLPAVWGGLIVVAAGLQAETVYTVVVVAAVGVGAGRGAD
ncbi:MAG: hypothetical protein AB7Q69_15205 [Gemmatimonadales bacterium]